MSASEKGYSVMIGGIHAGEPHETDVVFAEILDPSAGVYVPQICVNQNL